MNPTNKTPTPEELKHELEKMRKSELDRIKTEGCWVSGADPSTRNLELIPGEYNCPPVHTTIEKRRLDELLNAETELAAKESDLITMFNETAEIRKQLAAKEAENTGLRNAVNHYLNTFVTAFPSLTYCEPRQHMSAVARQIETMQRDLMKSHAERDALKEQKESWRVSSICRELTAERDSLKAQIANFTAEWQAHVQSGNEQIDRMKAEIERLRDSLLRCQKGPRT